jgi:hypothetical protein
MGSRQGNAFLPVASVSIKHRRSPSKKGNPSADRNDMQGPKSSPVPSNAVIRTGWAVNLAIAVPRPQAGMLGLGDGLSFKDERPHAAI